MGGENGVVVPWVVKESCRLAQKSHLYFMVKALETWKQPHKYWFTHVSHSTLKVKSVLCPLAAE